VLKVKQKICVISILESKREKSGTFSQNCCEERKNFQEEVLISRLRNQQIIKNKLLQKVKSAREEVHMVFHSKQREFCL